MTATRVNQASMLQEKYLRIYDITINVNAAVARRIERFSGDDARFEGLRLRANVPIGLGGPGGALGITEANRPASGRARNVETLMFAVQIGDTVKVQTSVKQLSSGGAAYMSVPSQEILRCSQFRTIETERMWLNDGTGVLAGGPGTAATSSYGIGALTVVALAPALIIDVPEFTDPRFLIGSYVNFLNVAVGVTGTANDYAGLYGATMRDNPAGSNGFSVANTTTSPNSTDAVPLTRVTFNEPSVGNVVTTNDYAVRMGAVAMGIGPGGRNVMQEPIGLKGLIDDGVPPMLTETAPTDYPSNGTHQGLDPSASGLGRSWQSTVVNAHNLDFSRDMVARAVGRQHQYGKGSTNGVRFWVLNEFAMRKYLSSVNPQEVFVTTADSKSQFDVGPSWLGDDEIGPQILGFPTIHSRMCDIDKAFGVGSGIGEYIGKKWGWMGDEIGAPMWTMAQDGSMAYEATAYELTCYGQQLRNNHLRIENMTTA